MTGITFIIRGEPIRVTQQQHRFGGHKANGKAIVYKDDRLASAYDWLCMEMRRQMTEAKNINFRKIDEGCTVYISWYFGTTTKRLQGRYKITRPDVDNLAKGDPRHAGPCRRHRRRWPGGQAGAGKALEQQGRGADHYRGLLIKVRQVKWDD